MMRDANLGDTNSTAGFVTNPHLLWRPLRDDLKLAQLLRKNLLTRECCQQKLADAQAHHHGKPLHTLRFKDIVCCCCEEHIAKIAQAHLIAHAYVDDDELDDGADTQLVSDRRNVCTQGSCKAAACEDEGKCNSHVRIDDDGDEDIDAHLHEENADCYSDNNNGRGMARTVEAMHADKCQTDDRDEKVMLPLLQRAIISVRETYTQKGIPSYQQELAHIEAKEFKESNKTQGLQVLQYQSPTKRFKPFCYHDDNDRPHLSHDLLLDVLLRSLPLAQVISARAVCRAWHEVLTSSQGFGLLAQNRDAARRYVIVQTSSPRTPSGLAFFDTVRKCWPCTPIPLPPLPLLAAAGGLLCFGENFHSLSWNGVLLVGNPLTQQWKELPRVPVNEEEGCLPGCAMSADWQEACYKVFVVYLYKDNICIFTYDSASRNWGRHKQDYAKPKLVDHVIDTFYLKTTFNISPQGCLLQVSCEERHILSYNTRNGCFCVIKLERDPPYMDKLDLNIKSAPYARLPMLAFCSGKLYLVGRTVNASCKVGGRLPFVLHGSLGIWELRVNAASNRGEWRGPISEVGDLESAVAGSDGTDFYVTTDTQSTIYLFLAGGTTMLAYDVSSKSWSCLPGCPSAHLLNLQGEAYYQPLLWPFPL